MMIEVHVGEKRITPGVLQANMTGMCGPKIRLAKWTRIRVFQSLEKETLTRYFPRSSIPLHGITDITVLHFYQQNIEMTLFTS